jgi:thioredoxin reductase (NADPH)
MTDRTDEIRSTRAPKLREDQIEVLSRYGQTRETETGEVLFRAGDTSSDFIVVLEGEVELVDDFAGERRTMGVMRPGRFVGDLILLTGQAAYLSVVVRSRATPSGPSRTSSALERRLGGFEKSWNILAQGR